MKQLDVCFPHQLDKPCGLGLAPGVVGRLLQEAFDLHNEPHQRALYRLRPCSRLLRECSGDLCTCLDIANIECPWIFEFAVIETNRTPRIIAVASGRSRDNGPVGMLDPDLWSDLE